jgi:hypothetical protein
MFQVAMPPRMTHNEEGIKEVNIFLGLLAQLFD